MKKINSQLRLGAVLSYINIVVGSLIPVVYTPVMLRILGQEEYGLYKLSSSVISYLSLISLGIGSAVVRYFTKYIAEQDKEGEENIFGLFNIIFAIISAIAFIVGILIAVNIGRIYGESLSGTAINGMSQLNEMRVLIVIMSANTSLIFLCTPYSAVVTSHERFVFLQCANILLTIVGPVANLLVLFFGLASIGMAISSLTICACAQMMYIIYVRKSIGIKPRYNNMPKYLIKEIFVFSFWIFVANIVNQLYNTTDTLIIGYVPKLATSGVAVYNIGVTFNNMVMSFSMGILNVTTPKVNNMVFTNKSNSELTNLMIRIGRIQCYIVALVISGFIAFGQPFIKLWVGNSYLEAYWVALVTIIPISIPLIQNVALSIIVAQNKHAFRSLVYLGIAIINVVGTIFCVNRFGIVGAALVTGISYIIGQGFVMNWYYSKKIGLEISRFWKTVLPLFIVPISLCVFTLFISRYLAMNNWISLLVGIIIYSVVFVILNWTVVMNDYEKDIFRKPFGRIYKVVRR